LYLWPVTVFREKQGSKQIIDKLVGKHFYYKEGKKNKAHTKQRVNMWLEEEKKYGPYSVTQKDLSVDLQVLEPVLKDSILPNPSLELLDSMEGLASGFASTWDLNITPVHTRVQMLLGAIGQVLKALPNRHKVEGLRDSKYPAISGRSGRSGSGSSSSSGMTLEQLRQCYMHRVFLSPVFDAEYCASYCAQYPREKRPPLEHSCCLEWDPKLVSKAPGMSGIKPKGYLKVYLGVRQLPSSDASDGEDGGQQSVPTKYVLENAHRIICWARCGPPPFGNDDAAHVCHNKMCLNPWHLEWHAHQVNCSQSQR
jgi:hypothetical protein